MKKSLLFVLLTALSLPATAEEHDEPMMVFDVGKITLYPSRMGMTGTENLMTCLQSLPSLVQKGTIDLLSNFTLKEDNNTYLHDATIYLEQTQISEVEKIEIITDGSVSDGLSGVLGIINVITKTPEVGTHGYIDLMATTNGEVYPTLHATHRQGIFSVTGSLMGLFDRDRSDTYSSTSDFSLSHEYIKIRHRDEAAKVKLKWETPRDIVMVKAAQLYERDRTTDIFDHYSDNDNSSKDSRSLDVSNKFNVYAEYDHVFNGGGTLLLAASVEQTNKTDNSESTADLFDISETSPMRYSSTLDDTYSDNTCWSTTLKYITSVTRRARLSIALPMSWTSTDEDIYRQFDSAPENEELKKIDQKYSVHRYNPFFILSVNLARRWDMTVGCRYSIARYAMDDANNGNWSTTRKALVAKAGLKYRPADRHTLMANFRTTAAMPGVLQLYPYRWFSQSPNIYYVGNPDLKSSEFQVVDLMYTYSHPKLQLSSSLQYYINRHSYKSVTLQYDATDGEMAWISQSGDNGGSVKTYDANISAVYIFGCFQTMAGVNVYHQENSDDSHTTWCCLRLSPTLKFKKKWTLSGQFSYVSPQTSATQRIGESFYGLVRLSKSWSNGVSIFAYWENFLNHDSIVKTYATPSTFTRTRTHENKLSLGLSFKFL
jgi:hypothetical protein